ncbi:MAG: ABC transporter substrate-binding protein [bacterium]
MKRLMKWSSVVLLVVSLLTACGPGPISTSTPEPGAVATDTVVSATPTPAVPSEAWMRGRDPLKFGGTLTLARAWEPLSMDSLLTTYGDQAHMYISEPPWTAGPEGEFGPNGWLESIEKSSDGLVFTFHIEPDVTFHDGTALDAEAFAWLIRKRIEDESVYSDPFLHVPDSDHIVVVDEYTVEIRQEEQSWPELPINMSDPTWAGAMRVPRAVERYGEDYGFEMAYGNGPFALEEWVKGDHLTLVRNEDFFWAPPWAEEYAGLEEGEEYHPGPPYLEEVVLKYVPEDATRVAMLRTGEVDGIVEVPPHMVEEIENIPNVSLVGASSYEVRYIGYNTTKAPLDDERVRKALNYAIDREALVDAIYFGYAEPAYSLFCGKDLETPNTEQMYKHDADEASALLAEAGWEDTDGDGILDKDGQPLTFSLWSSDKTEYRKLAEIAAGMWREFGVDATLRTFDEATLRDRITAGEHEAIVLYHGWITKSDMYNWWFSPESKWYPQESGLDTPELRELVAQTYEATTMEEVDETNDELMNYYYGKAPLCALVWPDSLFAINDSVMNVVPRGEGWWGWMPYLYDVYRADVYEANQARAGE